MGGVDTSRTGGPGTHTQLSSGPFQQGITLRKSLTFKSPIRLVKAGVTSRIPGTLEILNRRLTKS